MGKNQHGEKFHVIEVAHDLVTLLMHVTLNIAGGGNVVPLLYFLIQVGVIPIWTNGINNNNLVRTLIQTFAV